MIWTPGHAAEHICLHDAERRILFSGDHVLPKITSHVSEHTWEKRDPLGDYLTSLVKVRDLPVDLILPGHETSFTNLPDRVTQLFKHHEARLEEVKSALKNGKSTVFEVASVIHWDSRPWLVMDFWTKRMAATETYAHLIYLRNKGEITEKDGRRYTILHSGLTPDLYTLLDKVLSSKIRDVRRLKGNPHLLDLLKQVTVRDLLTPPLDVLIHDGLSNLLRNPILGTERPIVVTQRRSDLVATRATESPDSGTWTTLARLNLRHLQRGTDKSNGPEPLKSPVNSRLRLIKLSLQHPRRTRSMKTKVKERLSNGRSS